MLADVPRHKLRAIMQKSNQTSAQPFHIPSELRAKLLIDDDNIAIRDSDLVFTGKSHRTTDVVRPSVKITRV